MLLRQALLVSMCCPSYSGRLCSTARRGLWRFAAVVISRFVVELEAWKERAHGVLCLFSGGGCWAALWTWSLLMRQGGLFPIPTEGRPQEASVVPVTATWHQCGMCFWVGKWAMRTHWVWPERQCRRVGRMGPQVC